MMRAIRTKRQETWYAIVGACAVLTIVVPAAFSKTWYIKPDGTGDAPTIQAGVDAASPGDIVLVAAGTYATTSVVDVNGTPSAVCVAIGKDIRLLSESGSLNTTIGNASANIAIYIHDVGSSAEINGFRIQTAFEPYACVDGPSEMTLNGPLPPFLKRGISCRNGSPLITNNNITTNGAAVELLGSPATLTANTVTLAPRGIACLDGSDAVIANNVIHTCASAISCDASSPTVTGNDLYDGCTGIRSRLGSPIVTDNLIHDFSPYGIDCATSITLENNHISDNAVGVFLGGVGITVVRGNIFNSHFYYAIEIWGPTEGAITIEGNTIDGSGSAIFCQAGANPLIRRNIIVRSFFGIRCALSSFPVMECNDVVTFQARYIGDCTDQTGLNGNISVDPQFCGLTDSGNYGLQGDSPCAPGNHPSGYSCGRIGARDVACGAVATKSTTWGAIKAMYKE